MKTLAPKYFPNIRPYGIVYVTGRVPVRPMVWPEFADGATDRNVSRLFWERAPKVASSVWYEYRDVGLVSLTEAMSGMSTTHAASAGGSRN